MQKNSQQNLILRFLSKQQTTIAPVNFQKLTLKVLFLSLTVDTQLITSIYGCTHKDVHFYWLNAEMIGILRQLKFTCTETNISDGHTKGYACLMDEKSEY